MARRRSKTSATGGNMDSLLDALTNVVGILVIVLVAVQISSQEAARRMEEMIIKIDPEELKKIEQQAQEAKAKIDQVTQAIALEKKQEKIDPEKLLRALRDDIEAAEKRAKADRIAAETAEKAAEKAKQELSGTLKTTISLPFIATGAEGPLHLETSLERRTFESLCPDLLDRLLRPVQSALRDARLTPDDIDEVVMVGGSMASVPPPPPWARRGGSGLSSAPSDEPHVFHAGHVHDTRHYQ